MQKGQTNFSKAGQKIYYFFNIKKMAKYPFHLRQTVFKKGQMATLTTKLLRLILQ